MCPESFFFHLKILSFKKCRCLQHDYSSGLAGSWSQFSSRDLSWVCVCLLKSCAVKPVLSLLSVWEGLHECSQTTQPPESTDLRNSDQLWPTRLARGRGKATSVFPVHCILKTRPRNLCATERLAFSSMCADVHHFCQILSVFDPLLATILQKGMEVPQPGAVSVCPGWGITSLHMCCDLLSPYSGIALFTVARSMSHAAAFSTYDHQFFLQTPPFWGGSAGSRGFSPAPQ